MREGGPPRRDPGAPATPVPDLTVTYEEVADDGDKTQEWSLPLLSEADAHPGAIPGTSRDPFATTVAAHRADGSVGSVPSRPVDLDSHAETPTAPLPVEAPAEADPSASAPRLASGDAGDERGEESLDGDLDAGLAEELEIVDTGLELDLVVAAPEPDGGYVAPRSHAASLLARGSQTSTPSPPEPQPGRAAAPVPARPTPPPLAVPRIEPARPAASETWSEPLAARPRRKRLKPWFEEVFDEDYLRTLPFMTAEQTLREANFIKEGLSPVPEGELLDVGCGYGRHAIELAQRGLRVTGIDLSLPLLIRAADESQRRGLSVNFVHADMRELSFDNQFDGAYSFLTTFGYFDEETNLKVATGVFRSLRPGGRFLVDSLNRDYIVGDLPTRVWWEGDGCLVLEEVDFNYHTSRVAIRRSVVFQDGRQLEHDISIRAYSLHELAKVMRQAGFRVLEVSGSLATRGHFFGATSRNIIMLCEKPAT